MKFVQIGDDILVTVSLRSVLVERPGKVVAVFGAGRAGHIQISEANRGRVNCVIFPDGYNDLPTIAHNEGDAQVYPLLWAPSVEYNPAGGRPNCYRFVSDLYDN